MDDLLKRLIDERYSLEIKRNETFISQNAFIITVIVACSTVKAYLFNKFTYDNSYMDRVYVWCVLTGLYVYIRILIDLAISWLEPPLIELARCGEWKNHFLKLTLENIDDGCRNTEFGNDFYERKLMVSDENSKKNDKIGNKLRSVKKGIFFLAILILLEYIFITIRQPSLLGMTL